jgi:WhiB family redox-sensing transcriptional regulator
MNWRHRAECRDYDPELFFPVATAATPEGQAQLTQAAAVCARCPVRECCLAWALNTNQQYGVWGGLGEAERRRMRRERRWLDPEAPSGPAAREAS